MSYKQDIQYISNLDLPWEKLNGCNILITGASGLIGSCLVESLVSNHNKAYHIFASGRSVKRLRDRFKNYINDHNTIN